MKDIYFDLITQHEEEILGLYMLFKEKHPIMEYNVQEEKIYACSYDEYVAGLSKKSQETTKKQYIEAIKNNELVVFVRDLKNRKLRSYCMDTN